MKNNKRKIYIATLGRTKEPVLAGFRSDIFDFVYILTNDNKKEKDPKRNPINVAKEVVDQIENSFKVKCEIREINPFLADDILEEVVRIYKNHKSDTITVNITGGTNVMAASAFLAGHIIGARVIYIMESEEGTEFPGSDRVIDLPTPRIPVNDLPREKRKILVILAKEAEFRKDEWIYGARKLIREKMDKTAPTVTHHLRELRKLGLIEEESRGKSKLVKLSPSGKLLAKFYVDELS